MQPLVEPEITGEMNLKLEAKVERLIEVTDPSRINR